MITLEGVRKSYNIGQPSETEVLHGVDLQVRHGEFLALIGPSGSGKSTLLNIVGLLERMTAGRYALDGEAVQDLDDAGLTLRRRQTLGFVFQFHHLLPEFSAVLPASPFHISSTPKKLKSNTNAASLPQAHRRSLPAPSRTK